MFAVEFDATAERQPSGFELGHVTLRWDDGEHSSRRLGSRGLLMVYPAAADMLDGVATLFANRWLLLAGWVHYLAFDLLIGTWEARDARERGLPHLLLVPCLFLTLMFGPAGWLAYIGVRGLRGAT